jgi:hypothetical protein
MHFCMVLLVVVKHLAGKFELLGLFVVPGSHQHLEPRLLQLSQLELPNVHVHCSLPLLQLRVQIVVVYGPLHYNLVLLAR